MTTKFFNQSTSGGGQFYWPSNIEDQYDYLEMDILRFSQRNILKRDRERRLINQRANAVPSTDATSSVPGQTIPSTEQKTSTTNLKSKGKILLPIPDNVSYTDGPQWSDQSVGALGRFGAQAIQELMSGDPEKATDAIRAAAEVGKVDVVKRLLQRIGVDPNALSQNVAGKIANPYLQQVFQGVGMRQFDFNWKLVPRNEREQKSIHNIIKTLRKNVLPGFSDDFSEGVGRDVNSIGNMLQADLGAVKDSDGNAITGGFAGRPEVDRWLTLPNIFNLKWMYSGGELDSLPKLKQCVCKNISVQYTPDGVWATRMMGGVPQPIAYNLTMSFGEMSIVTNSDVAKGF
jgi:hypothetical protein